MACGAAAVRGAMAGVWLCNVDVRSARRGSVSAGGAGAAARACGMEGRARGAAAPWGVTGMEHWRPDTWGARPAPLHRRTTGQATACKAMPAGCRPAACLRPPPRLGWTGRPRPPAGAGAGAGASAMLPYALPCAAIQPQLCEGAHGLLPEEQEQRRWLGGWRRRTSTARGGSLATPAAARTHTAVPVPMPLTDINPTPPARVVWGFHPNHPCPDANTRTSTRRTPAQGARPSRAQRPPSSSSLLPFLA